MQVEKYDCELENTEEFDIVPEGSVWEESRCNYIDGEIHLEAISDLGDMTWIEISKESLKAHFKEVSNE